MKNYVTFRKHKKIKKITDNHAYFMSDRHPILLLEIPF